VYFSTCVLIYIHICTYTYRYDHGIEYAENAETDINVFFYGMTLQGVRIYIHIFVCIYMHLYNHACIYTYKYKYIYIDI
jgi:hypothetical protein